MKTYLLYVHVMVLMCAYNVQASSSSSSSSAGATASASAAVSLNAKTKYDASQVKSSVNTTEQQKLSAAKDASKQTGTIEAEQNALAYKKAIESRAIAIRKKMRDMCDSNKPNEKKVTLNIVKHGKKIPIQAYPSDSILMLYCYLRYTLEDLQIRNCRFMFKGENILMTRKNMTIRDLMRSEITILKHVNSSVDIVNIYNNHKLALGK